MEPATAPDSRRRLVIACSMPQSRVQKGVAPEISTFDRLPYLSMPTITAKDIVFHYTDSGLPVNKEDYSTLFVIHGHSFHSGMSCPFMTSSRFY